MKCPTCNIELKMAERQGIEIDYCPQCRGVWLDRGELDKIIERSQQPMYMEQAQTPPPAQMPPTHHYGGKESYGYHGHKHKKKKSLLSELFDFD